MDKKIFRSAIKNCGGSEKDYYWMLEQLEEFDGDFPEKVWIEYSKLLNIKHDGLVSLSEEQGVKK